MSNYTETARNLAPMLIEDGTHANETYRSPATNPTTLADGTILARQLLSSTVTPAADGGNTGDATITAMMSATALGAYALLGTYVLECVNADTNNAEVFSVTAPDGAQLWNATAGVEYVSPHLNFTIPNDGSADWVVGDIINLPVVAGDMKVRPFAVAGLGGLDKIVGVHTEGDIVTTSAGDHAIRPLSMGGAVDKSLIRIDGSNPGVGITQAVVDALHDKGIRVVDATETTDGYPV